MASHVERIVRRGIHLGLWWESQNGYNWEDLDVGERIIIEYIFEI
jgi:hypothetical protein